MKLAILTAVSALAFAQPALAQVRATTPFESQPACFVKQAKLARTVGQMQFYSSERIILDWYAWGGQAVQSGWRPHLESFGLECFDKNNKGKCGLPYDKKISEALTKGFKNQDISPGGLVYEYFQKKPPAAAIQFAAKGVGMCFGADSPALSEIGWGPVDVELGTCASAGTIAEIKWRGADTRKEINAIEPEYRDARSWGLNLQSMRLTKEERQSMRCAAAPLSVYPALARGEAGRAEDRARDQRIRLAKERFANRPIEQRIAGLNGCQIAYSLVFNGINSSDTTVGKVPDGAISWALDYEKKNIKGDDCPPMPPVLSDWVQKQPLAKFEPQPDPYTALRSAKAPYSGNDYSSWLTFAGSWMGRYETKAATFKAMRPTDNQGSECDAALLYARSNALGPVNNADNGPSAFQTLARLGYSTDAQAAICQYVPVSIFPAAKQAWQNYADQKKAASLAAQQAPPLLRPAVPKALPKQNYLWKNAPTTRCYWAGDTKYGQKQVCFTS